MSFMQSDIAEVLQPLITSERLEMFARASDLLSESGVTAHEFAFNQLISRFDSGDSAEVIANVDYCILIALEDTLGSHGIEFNSPSIALCADALQTVLDIQDYGDPEALVRLMEDMQNPETTFAELVFTITQHSVIDVMEAIEKVDIAFMDTAKELIQKNWETLEAVSAASIPGSDEDAEYHEIRMNGIRDRLETFLSSDKAPHDPLVNGLITNGTPIGTDFDVLIEFAHEELELMEPEEMVSQLTALAYASDLETDELQEAVRVASQDVITSAKHYTRASVALEHLFGDS